MPRMVVVYGALLFVTLLYGANYTIAKFALPVFLVPLAFVSIRLLSGTSIFWAVSFFQPAEKVYRKDHWLLFKCGLFGTALNQLLFFQGLSLTTPIHGALIMTMSPIAVILVAALLGREKLTLLKIIGTLVGAVGVALLLTKGDVSLNDGTFSGDLFILLNGTSYAIYLVLVKPLMQSYKPLTVIKWIFLYGMLIAVPFGINELIATDWNALPPIAWASVLYVVLGTTITVYILNAWALRYVDSSVVGIFIYLQPVFATIVALSLGEDKLDFLTVLYALIIMAGVFMVSKK